MKCELTGFLGVLILVSWWLVSGNTVRAAEAARPNVVIFLADDAGWGDYGANGNTQVSTPSIDRRNCTAWRRALAIFITLPAGS